MRKCKELKNKYDETDKRDEINVFSIFFPLLVFLTIGITFSIIFQMEDISCEDLSEYYDINLTECELNEKLLFKDDVFYKYNYLKFEMITNRSR